MEEVSFPFDVDTFFKKCVKDNHIPRNDFEKQAILQKLMEEFEDRNYSEEEVNAIIKKYFEDFALLRRELINFGYMQRDPYKGEYKILRRKLTWDDVDKNTILKRHAQPYLTDDNKN